MENARTEHPPGNKHENSGGNVASPSTPTRGTPSSLAHFGKSVKGGKGKEVGSGWWVVDSEEEKDARLFWTLS